MKCVFVLLLTIASLCQSASVAEDRLAGDGAATRTDLSRCLVGAYYFAGWWEPLPNKYSAHGKDWRQEYPDRVPLLGEYNDQPTMDLEIVAASKSGIDFFQILWYPIEDMRQRLAAEGREMPPHVEKVNEGLRLFVNSSENRQLRFTLEFVNHAPFEIVDDARWEQACRLWCEVMRHPSYLKVGGRPVFKIHGLTAFQLQNRNDSVRTAGRVGKLRSIAQGMGLCDPLVGVGASPFGVPPAKALEPFDFVTTYMEVPRLEKRESLYPYEELLQLAENGWKDYSQHCGKPYIPYVPAGWDPRPWQDPRPSFELPTRQQWKAALESVAAALKQQDNLGLPTPGGRQRLFLIYAWNEYGEGGIVAPTRRDGHMKLETIKEVFGTASSN